jgi:hypothetical protein
MVTLVESAREIEASVERAFSTSSLKRRVADLWPTAIVAVGLSLSVAWTAGLFWLLYMLV